MILRSTARFWMQMEMVPSVCRILRPWLSTIYVDKEYWDRIIAKSPSNYHRVNNDHLITSPAMITQIMARIIARIPTLQKIYKANPKAIKTTLLKPRNITTIFSRIPIVPITINKIVHILKTCMNKHPPLRQGIFNVLFLGLNNIKDMCQ